jgi:hypothetical protein
LSIKSRATQDFSIFKTIARRKKVRLLKTLKVLNSPKKVASYSLKYVDSKPQNFSSLRELSINYSATKLLNSRSNYKEYNLSLILAKINNKISIVNKAKQSNLKEKYSFFSHFFYRKNILRSLLKISVFNLRNTTDISTKNTNLSLLNYYKYSHLFKKEVSNHDNDSDFSIQRIRFKPGYQVI